jgi:hypothetical protein
VIEFFKQTPLTSLYPERHYLHCPLISTDLQFLSAIQKPFNIIYPVKHYRHDCGIPFVSLMKVLHPGK